MLLSRDTNFFENFGRGSPVRNVFRIFADMLCDVYLGFQVIFYEKPDSSAYMPRNLQSHFAYMLRAGIRDNGSYRSDKYKNVTRKHLYGTYRGHVM